MSASKAPSWLTKGFGNPGNAKKKAKADSGSMNAATSASHRPPEPVQKEGVEGIVDDEKSPEDLGCSGDDYMSDSLLPSHPEPRLQKKVEEELRRWGFRWVQPKPVRDDGMFCAALSACRMKGRNVHSHMHLIVRSMCGTSLWR